MLPAIDEAAAFLGGYVAAEGTFGTSGPPSRFRFAIGVGATDRLMCDLFREFLDVGHVTESPRRKPHYNDEVTFSVQSARELVEVIVPFMDVHLPESYKHRQYLPWRERLLDHWATTARRRRPCTVDGCGQPSRAHGYCRHHLWEYRRQ